MKLTELIHNRKEYFDKIIPKKCEDALSFEQIQGPLYSSSLDNKNIVKDLLPLIMNDKTKLTEVIVDTWLNKRATKDFLNTKCY